MRKIRQLIKALKWQRQVRAALSTQLALLDNPSACTLGGLTDEEERRVAELTRLADAHVGPIVEFGTLFGLTTRLIAAEAPAARKVITVDNFCWNPFGLPPAQQEGFSKRVLRSELATGRVELYVGDSATFRNTYRGETPSMVFIDADHTYEAVRDEIAWAKALGVPVISGHDYGNARFGVTRAVDEAFAACVEVCGTVWSWYGTGSK